MPHDLSNDPDTKQRALAIYELSKLPQYSSLIALLTNVATDWYSNPPRSQEQRAAWETFTYVDFTVRHVIARLHSEIELGARLSNDEPGEPNDETDGHNRRRRV